MSTQRALNLFETPSRIWRRVQEQEAQDLPSLPELSELDDTPLDHNPGSPLYATPRLHAPVTLGDPDVSSNSIESHLPIQSTPTVTISSRRSSSQSRFAHSILARSSGMTSVGRSATKTASTVRFAEEHESFEISEILPMSETEELSTDNHKHLTDDEADYEQSLKQALESISRTPSPALSTEPTHQQTPLPLTDDYQAGLQIESKSSSIDETRCSSLRKSPLSRIQTPPLSYSPVSHSSSSSSHLTPENAEISLPGSSLRRSRNSSSVHYSSPTVNPEQTIATSPMPISEEIHNEPTFSDEMEPIEQSRAPNVLSTAYASILPANPYPSTLLETNSRDALPNVQSTPSPSVGFPTEGYTHTTISTRGQHLGSDDPLTPYTRRRSFLLSIVNSTTRPRLAFPTPRPRASHPLSQAHTPSMGSSDRLSFISTASSHDLTTHPRANASFDPLTGAKGVGRFNATKLNSYLHGLNRRLVEENQSLVQRLAAFQGGGDLQEQEDKTRIPEHIVDTLRTELVRIKEEKLQVELELDEERQEREKDKDRWKARMGEVEQGVEAIVKELERQAAVAEASKDLAIRKTQETENALIEMRQRAELAEEEVRLAQERILQVEAAMGDASDLGAQLRDANERIAAQREEASYTAQLLRKEIEEERQQVKVLEARNRTAQQQYDDLSCQLDDQSRQAAAKIEQLQKRLDQAIDHQHQYARELQASRTRLAEPKAMLEAEVVRLHENFTDTQAQVAALEIEREELRMELINAQASSSRRQTEVDRMEEAFEEAAKRSLADQQELASLRAKVLSMEQERGRIREIEASVHEPVDGTRTEVEQLEVELDLAHREIAGLNHLLNQSPARKAVQQAKEARIELLEQENAELRERVKALRTLHPISESLLTDGLDASSVHRPVLTIKTPKTPGAPLTDLSWLNSTNQQSTLTPLLRQITHLERQLAHANRGIDDKIDQLGEAGLGVIDLAKKLEEARTQIAQLKAEVGWLQRREDRRQRRMKRLRCQRCARVFEHVNEPTEGDQSSPDVSTYTLPPNPPTPPTKTSITLKNALESVNVELCSLRAKWRQEQIDLQEENGILKDAARRLNVEVGLARQETERGQYVRVTIQEELDAARDTVADLEDQLQVERQRLRSLNMQQSRTTAEKSHLLAQLHRTQSDLNDIKFELQVVKQTKHELEKGLQANATVDQKTRQLEGRASENQAVIDQLQEERVLLSTELAELRSRFTEVAERVDAISQQLCDYQAAHDTRRHELDLRVAEIEELHQILAIQATHLNDEQNRGDVAQTISEIEANLKAVRRDAEVFGRDLRLLQAEKDKWQAREREDAIKYERSQKQTQTRLRLAQEQLETQRERMKIVVDEFNAHVCAVNDNELARIRSQHKKECKGLMVQIRYLKAKFCREAILRADLGYQKGYLLVLLSALKNSEKQILASVARIGFPSPVSNRQRKRMKAVALSIMFVLRAQRAARQWKDQSASKKEVAIALQDVRIQRMTTAS